MRGHESPEYQAYIHSPTWMAKRATALDAADHRCQVCNRAKHLDVHHRTYERFGGGELPGDLTVLCRVCHDLFHQHGRVGSGSTPKPTPRVTPHPGRVAPGWVLALLHLHNGMTRAEIMAELGCSKSAAGRVLNALKRSGEIYRDNGRFYAQPQPGTALRGLESLDDDLDARLAGVP
jgi:CRP-like cAMP-binding protein